jgi:hypothetical protein
VSTVGIKIANGEFYPVTAEHSAVKKRLILTTVHDGQESVQIDLYKSVRETMSDAVYIGSLLLNHISPRPRGEPSIELIVGITEDGTLVADARDMDSSTRGDHQTLNVALAALDDAEHYQTPDFQIEENVSPPASLYAPEDAREKRSVLPLVLILIAAMLLLAGLCVFGWFFFLKDRWGGKPDARPGAAPSSTAPKTIGGPDEAAEPPPDLSYLPPAPPLPEPAPPLPEPAPPPPAEPAPPAEPYVQETPPPAPPPPEPAPYVAQETPPPESAARRRPAPPVASYKVPAVIPKKGVVYKVRWGDTLWDIAGAFYRNPWLYRRIASYNKIRNPNLIVAGRRIIIPPKK